MISGGARSSPKGSSQSINSKNLHRPGYFGEFGGRFVPETLVGALDELTRAYLQVREDAAFQEELAGYLRHYVGRPTPLYCAERLSERTGGARIYLKREDICHTGAHKINNTMGQVLLARRLGKRRIIAETGAGQHGLATATAAALFGLECHVYMGEEDVKRQSLNVFKMRLLGTEVIPVKSGSRTLKDAINEAMRDWVTNVETTHYILGSVVGPHPYPTIVRDFQAVIGREARAQILEAEGRLPDVVLAAVGGGSNSMGIFHPFIGEARLVGVEAGGYGIASGKHGASLTEGSKGVLHGSLSYVLQDAYGQVLEAHSISAGLDYPGVGPEHAFLKDEGLAEYVSVTDREALEGFRLLCETEGIIPALEPSHAVAYLAKLTAEAQEAGTRPEDLLILLCLSGRGDKDVPVVASEMGVEL